MTGDKELLFQCGFSGVMIVPQMNKGGKFIFGKSTIRDDGTIQIQKQAMEEYDIATEKKVYLFTGSKVTGGFIQYKGRCYCWAAVSETGQITLTNSMMDFLQIQPGQQLLSIRSSDIAFTMGAKGPLLERAKNYAGDIPAF